MQQQAPSHNVGIELYAAPAALSSSGAPAPAWAAWMQQPHHRVQPARTADLLVLATHRLHTSHAGPCCVPGLISAWCTQTPPPPFSHAVRPGGWSGFQRLAGNPLACWPLHARQQTPLRTPAWRLCIHCGSSTPVPCCSAVMAASTRNRECRWRTGQAHPWVQTATRPPPCCVCPAPRRARPPQKWRAACVGDKKHRPADAHQVAAHWRL